MFPKAELELIFRRSDSTENNCVQCDVPCIEAVTDGPQWTRKDRIWIYDSTLSVLQSHKDIGLTTDKKLEILHRLDLLGSDFIEVGDIAAETDNALLRQSEKIRAQLVLCCQIE